MPWFCEQQTDPYRQMTVFDERLKDVEKQLALHAEFLKSHWNQCANGVRPGAALTEHIDLSGVISGAEAQVSNVIDENTDQAPTDGMGISFVDENDFAFYGQSDNPVAAHTLIPPGPSSNIYFMRSIIRTLSSSRSSEETQTPTALMSTAESILKASRTQSSTIIQPDGGIKSPYALPTVSDMQQLLLIYFSNTSLMFPFIHEPSFMDDFVAAQNTGFAKVRLTWLGLLNMIFAMATSVGPCDESIKDRFAQSHIYYERATQLCHKEMLRGTTIETGSYYHFAANTY